MRTSLVVSAIAAALMSTAAQADDLTIALIYGKTGPLEAYAKQTETGLRMGLEYATKGTMTVDGRKIVVVPKDDQGKPDLSKAALAEAYREKADVLIVRNYTRSRLADMVAGSPIRRILTSAALPVFVRN